MTGCKRSSRLRRMMAGDISLTEFPQLKATEGGGPDAIPHEDRALTIPEVAVRLRCSEATV
jgi:hypothetical protein